jgi:hypothetical protein
VPLVTRNGGVTRPLTRNVLDEQLINDANALVSFHGAFDFLSTSMIFIRDVLGNAFFKSTKQA